MSDTNTIDEVFRTEWSRLVAILVRDFGDLELAEDCAQEAFVQAGKTWGNSVAFPDRPGAWLTTTARRKALDVIRRSASYEGKLAQLEVRARRGPDRPATSGLVDEQLALVLGCCHPALNLEAQVALTLRLVAGLSTEQIARGFLVGDDAMSKRITRAKRKIRAAGVPFDPVDASVLRDRLAAVLHVVYLIFTEGHSGRGDEALVRGNLCDEAIWLSELLTQLVPEDSEVHGLHALILLTDARRSTRIGVDGLPALLEDQDRTQWDQRKIKDGLNALGRAMERGPLGAVGLQALLASLHTTAPTFDATDWQRMVRTYDLLRHVDASPVIELNRAIAVSYAQGVEAGLAELEPLQGVLQGYLYLHSTTAEFLRRLGDRDGAARSYRHALDCEPSTAEYDFLHSRLATLECVPVDDRGSGGPRQTRSSEAGDGV